MDAEINKRILKDFWSAVDRGRGDEIRPVVERAWLDGDALAVVYKHPYYADLILGLRRSWPPHYMDNDPATTGMGVYAEIAEPPGDAVRKIAPDREGIIWMGDSV